MGYPQMDFSCVEVSPIAIIFGKPIYISDVVGTFEVIFLELDAWSAEKLT